MKKSFLFLMSLLLIAGMLCGCNTSSSSSSGSGNSGEITAINLSETSLDLTVGETATLEVTVEPAGTPAANLNWTSDNYKAVSVTDGIVKALEPGSAVVTVKTENGLSKSCSVTVSAVDVKSISLDVTEKSVNEGDTFFITATVTPDNFADDELTWYSSNSKIAVVTNTGKVSAVSAGSTKIICRASNGVEASCNLTVKGSSQQSNNNANSGNNNSNNGSPNVVYVYLDRDPGGHLNPYYQPYESDFVFPYSSVTRLTDSEIRATLNNMYGGTISGSYAQDAINEIYARNGYVFKTPSIRNYYAGKPWYWENPNFSENDFSSTEKYNIKMLTKYT